jgi:hypothetical protein
LAGITYLKKLTKCSNEVPIGPAKTRDRLPAVLPIADQ